MARNKVIQMTCSPELFQKITDYKESKDLKSDSDTVRDLVLFALEILERSNDDDAISTRELLEQILYFSIKGQYLETLDYFDSGEYRNEKYEKTESKHANVSSKALQKFQNILKGEVD